MMPIEEHWSLTISFYERLVSEGYDLQPMRKLVREIAETKYARLFYPTHFILCCVFRRRSRM